MAPLGCVTGYCIEGQHYVKVRTRLDKEKMMGNPRFVKNFENADLFARAQKLAAFVYRQIPRENRSQKKTWYPMRNRAQELLRNGMGSLEIVALLQKEFPGMQTVEPPQTQLVNNQVPAAKSKARVQPKMEEILLGRHIGRVDSMDIMDQLSACSTVMKQLLETKTEGISYESTKRGLQPTRLRR